MFILISFAIVFTVAFVIIAFGCSARDERKFIRTLTEQDEKLTRGNHSHYYNDHGI